MSETQNTGPSFFRKYFFLALYTVFFYLVQVCIAPYVRLNGISANVLFAFISVVVVAFGKLRAFWVGCVYGILMEIMLPSFSFFNLAIYPFITLFCSFLFADKNQQQVENSKLRSGKGNRPLIRTFGCAFATTTVYEILNVVYIYISGTPIDRGHILRALTGLVYTLFVTVVIMFPVRKSIFGRWDKPQKPFWMQKNRTNPVV